MAFASIFGAGFALSGCGEPAEPPPAAPTKLWELGGFSNPESALFDAAAKIIFVSNVNGKPTDKDGNGFISKVSADGKMDTLEWVKGLNGPKGLALAKGKLYAADIDQLVEIDIASGTVTNRYDGAGAQFFNDAVADPEGRIYVSDMATNKIWRLDNGKFEVWLDDPKLAGPNGLIIQDGSMIVASWGVMTDGFATKVPGNLLEIPLADKSIIVMGDGQPLGNLDGIEPDGEGRYLVTDWMNGKFYRIDPTGTAVELLSLEQGAADIGYDPATKTVYIPQMMKGMLYAYKVE